MTDAQALEQYFNALLHDEGKYQEHHALADAGARFALYRKLRLHCSTMSGHLATSGRVVYGKHKSYQAMLMQFANVFGTLATMQDDQLDFYVRMLTVEQLTLKKPAIAESAAPIGQALGCFVEGLLAVLFNTKDAIRMTAKALINHYAPPAFLAFLPLPLIQIWEDKKLKDWLQQAYAYYNLIEQELLSARNGVIARDKKMLLTLRSMKLGLGKAMIQAAMGKTSMASMPDYLPPVVAMAKDVGGKKTRGN